MNRDRANLKSLLVFVLGLVMLFGLPGREAAAGGKSDGGSVDKGKLVIYSPHGQDILELYSQKFQDETGVTVEWLFLGAQECYDRIKSERANPQADVFFGGPTSTFIEAVREGLLQAYKPSWDSAVASQFKDPDGYWYGNWQTPVIIFYNNRELTQDQAPKSWDDLTDPKWANKINIRYPLASGAMRSLYASLVYREYKKINDPAPGYDFLRKLDANTKEYSNHSTVLFQGLARGEAVVSAWALPDVQNNINKNNMPFTIVSPSDGSPIITDSLGIVANAKNLENAKAFVEFINNIPNAVEQAEKFNRIPTRTDALAQCPAWMRDPIKAMDVDWAVLAREQNGWLKYWEENIRGVEKVK
jgi:iron(III) transport system substrate-binding protein